MNRFKRPEEAISYFDDLPEEERKSLADLFSKYVLSLESVKGISHWRFVEPLDEEFDIEKIAEAARKNIWPRYQLFEPQLKAEIKKLENEYFEASSAYEEALHKYNCSYASDLSACSYGLCTKKAVASYRNSLGLKREKLAGIRYAAVVKLANESNIKETDPEFVEILKKVYPLPCYKECKEGYDYDEAKLDAEISFNIVMGRKKLTDEERKLYGCL